MGICPIHLVAFNPKVYEIPLLWCALLCMFLWSVLKVCTFRNDIYIPTHPRYCRFKKRIQRQEKEHL